MQEGRDAFIDTYAPLHPWPVDVVADMAVQVSAYKSQHDKPPVMGVFVAVPLPDQRRCKRRQGRGTTATTVAPTRSVRLLTRRLSRKSRGKRTNANLGGCCVRQSRGTLRT